MLRGNLGTATLYDAATLLEALASNGKPFPPDVQNANRLVVPAGESPARGWFLCRLADIQQLDKFDVNLPQNLHLEYADDSGKVIDSLDLYNLVVTKEPINCTPGYLPRDTNSVYLVEVSDQRWLLDNPGFSHAIYDKQYNVRAPAYVGAKSTDTTTNQDPARYYYNTLNAAKLNKDTPPYPTPWTWSDMVKDLWNLIALLIGAFPGLPAHVPGDTLLPEGFVFQGISAWKAVNMVLARLGCMVKCDLTQLAGKQYTIVRVGDPDVDATATINTAITAGRKIHDGEFWPVVQGRLPANVRVLYHTLQQAGMERTVPNDKTQWQAGNKAKTDTPGDDTTGSVYAVDQPSPLTGSATNIFHPIWDDLPAIYAWDKDAKDVNNNPTPQWKLTNKADLENRSKVRTADYYRLQASIGGTRLWLQFSGLVKIAAGSTLKGVAWVGNARGVYTEVVCHPFLALKVEGNGAWGTVDTLEDSSRLHAPNFRPTWPVYPEKVQILKLVHGTPNADGTYDAQVMYSDGNGGYTPGGVIQKVWAKCLNTATNFADGTLVEARLMDWWEEPTS